MYANLHLSAFQVKPFTPILGETCNYIIGDMNIYLENTVSKPPTINFYGFSEKFKIYGYIPLEAKTGPNSVVATKNGKFMVEFDDSYLDETNEKINKKDVYELYYPVLNIKGINMGKRLTNYDEIYAAVSFNYNLASIIKFNPDKRGKIGSLFGMNKKTLPDYSSGYIVDSKLVSIKKNGGEIKSEAKEKDYLCNIEGEWSSYISFDKERYWSREEVLMPKIKKPDYLLPSDSSLRLDIIAFKNDNLEEAQKHKEIYEQIQRDDRTLRKNKGKKK